MYVCIFVYTMIAGLVADQLSYPPGTSLEEIFPVHQALVAVAQNGMALRHCAEHLRDDQVPR